MTKLYKDSVTTPLTEQNIRDLIWLRQWLHKNGHGDVGSNAAALRWALRQCVETLKPMRSAFDD